MQFVDVDPPDHRVMRVHLVKVLLRHREVECHQSRSLVGNPWCCPRIICFQTLPSIMGSSSTAYLVKLWIIGISSCRLSDLQFLERLVDSVKAAFLSPL